MPTPTVPAIQFLRSPGPSPNSIISRRAPPIMMQGEQHHEAPLRDLEQRLVGEAQETVQRGLAVERLAERPEMQRAGTPRARSRTSAGPGTPSTPGGCARESRCCASSRATTPYTARRPRTRIARPTICAAMSAVRSRTAKPLSRDGGKTERHVHGARDHEHAVERADEASCRGCGPGSRPRSSLRAPRR